MNNMSPEMLAVAQRISPTLEVAQAFTKISQTMRLEEESDKDIVIALAESMLDGLKHGNWPTQD